MILIISSEVDISTHRVIKYLYANNIKYIILFRNTVVSL